jgi:hypothetical protein
MTRAPHPFTSLQLLAATLAALLFGCGDDDGGNAADRLGVGAQCARDADCLQSTVDGGISQTCLTQFKGGYCGVEDCTSAEDCPMGSACVAHDDGNNYCFRICADKPECNLHRDADNESNCSANVDYVEEPAGGAKACVPPSGS